MTGWINAEKTQPPLIEGEDYSLNVWGWDGDALRVVAFYNDTNEWGWGNCYGDIWGDAELDDAYKIQYWKPILIPVPPVEDILTNQNEKN